ncbi:MAG TPA: GNAT family N-acetyltransferase [Thermoanaerobaculia bacterium]|nr:GNAT family N-acetyltransferase [Thermoanaerobaculia bacterium]
MALPLETPRLILRRFRDEDLDPFLEYRNHPEVARYQSWIEWTREQGLDFLRDQQRVEPGDLGRWFQYAMELKAGGALIGDCGICLKIEKTRTAEIGFSLAPGHQRQGLAFEGVSRMVDHAFREMGVARIVATVIHGNDRSAALLNRLGLSHGAPERVWFKGQWAEELRFALDRADWLVRSGESL